MREFPQGGIIGKTVHLWRRISRLRVPLYAANASFFMVLAVFPGLLLLLGLLRYTPLEVERLGEMLAGFVPEDFRVNDVPHKAVLAVTPRCLEQRGRFEGVIGIELVRGGACCEPIDTIWKNNSFLEASDL